MDGKTQRLDAHHDSRPLTPLPFSSSTTPCHRKRTTSSLFSCFLFLLSIGEPKVTHKLYKRPRLTKHQPTLLTCVAIWEKKADACRGSQEKQAGRQVVYLGTAASSSLFVSWPPCTTSVFFKSVSASVPVSRPVFFCRRRRRVLCVCCRVSVVARVRGESGNKKRAGGWWWWWWWMMKMGKRERGKEEIERRGRKPVPFFSHAHRASIQ